MIASFSLLSPEKANFGLFFRHIAGHNSPDNRGWELFKVFKDVESLVVFILKRLGSFGFERHWWASQLRQVKGFWMKISRENFFAFQITQEKNPHL